MPQPDNSAPSPESMPSFRGRPAPELPEAATRRLWLVRESIDLLNQVADAQQAQANRPTTTGIDTSQLFQRQQLDSDPPVNETRAA